MKKPLQTKTSPSFFQLPKKVPYVYKRRQKFLICMKEGRGDKEAGSKQRGRQSQTFNQKVKNMCQIYRINS